MVAHTLLVFFGIIMFIELLLLGGLVYLYTRVAAWQAQVNDWRNQLPEAVAMGVTLMREGKVTLGQLGKALTWIEKRFPLWLRACLTTMRLTKRSLVKTVEARSKIL